MDLDFGSRGSRTELFWQTIETGGPQIYGDWARANPSCLRNTEITLGWVQMTQLIMAVVSACQVVFMISRAPKVPWEAIYLPLSEMITYTLAYFGHGYVLLASGKTLPWARMASWVCTCPIMLGMISNMALVKYKSQPLNPLMVAASLGRLTFGISATMSDGGTTLWCFFLLGISFFMLEYSTVYAIFGIAIDDFASVQSPLGDLVVHRLNILRGIFYFSWTAFPIIWLISHSCLCVVDENTAAVLFLVADVVCKNSYGIVLWSTTWGILNGKWDREYAANRGVDGMLLPESEKRDAAPPPDDFGIKMFGTTIASVRRSARRPKMDLELGRQRKNRRRHYSSEEESESESGDDHPQRRHRRGRKRGDDEPTGGSVDKNIEQIMAAMKRNAEESLRLEIQERELATKANVSEY